jgi:hypothetical protein
MTPEMIELQIENENLRNINQELEQQLELVGESLRILSHELLEVNRHANDAYQRHAVWLSEYQKAKRNAANDNSSEECSNV